jgi:hypothetical protein
MVFCSIIRILGLDLERFFHERFGSIGPAALVMLWIWQIRTSRKPCFQQGFAPTASTRTPLNRTVARCFSAAGWRVPIVAFPSTHDCQFLPVPDIKSKQLLQRTRIYQCGSTHPRYEWSADFRPRSACHGCSCHQDFLGQSPGTQH